MANINGTTGKDTLEGTEADDRIRGLAGNDILYGYGGDDLLDGGPGNDRLRGGAGNDIYIVDAEGDLVVEREDEGYDTVRSSVSFTLGAHVERLELTNAAGGIKGTGNELDNYMLGSAAGGERLYGLAGNDRLDGNGGGDTLYGGLGDDTYIIRSSADVTSESGGGGQDTLKIMGVDFTLSSGIEDAIVLGDNVVFVTGNSLANVITGSDAGNVMYGEGGNDRIRGGDGFDELHGGTGADVLVGEGGADTYAFSSEAEIQLGDRIVESVNDGSIDRLLTGGKGFFEADLSLVDFSGIEYFESTTPVTTFSVYQIAEMRDDYDAGELADLPTIVARELRIADGGYVNLDPFSLTIDVSTRIRLSDEGNTVDSGGNWGGFEVAVYGGAGDDTILGGFGPPQTLFGRDGDDWLDGGTSGGIMGSGPAQLSGGSGADVFTMTGSAGRSADILDFRNGTDQVAFTQNLNGGGYLSYQEFLDFGGTVTAENGGTRLTLSGSVGSPDGYHTETYFLAGIDPSRIDASDFYQA